MKTKLICPTCSNIFYRWPYEIKRVNRISCSKICMRATKEKKDLLSKKYQRENNPNWKGKNAGLEAIHIRITKIFPKKNLCEMCRLVPPMDLANISQEYREDISDWQWLCRKCHMESDGRLKVFIMNNKNEKINEDIRILPKRKRGDVKNKQTHIEKY